MGLTAEDIEGRVFASALRGYDRGEVRSFLARVAATVAGLEEECAQLRHALVDSVPGRSSDVALVDQALGAPPELAGAGSQVAHLLEQARAHGEMIRQEAEELARVRVRRAMDQAEQRLNVLRTTEQAARGRIEAAQRELADALQRLDGDPAPGFARDEPERTVADAARVADTDPALDAVPPMAVTAAAPAPPPPPPRWTSLALAGPMAAPGVAGGHVPSRVAAPPPAPVAAPDPAASPSPVASASGASPHRAGTGRRRVAATGGDDALATLVRQAMQRAVESAGPGRSA